MRLELTVTMDELQKRAALVHGRVEDSLYSKVCTSRNKRCPLSAFFFKVSVDLNLFGRNVLNKLDLHFR